MGNKYVESLTNFISNTILKLETDDSDAEYLAEQLVNLIQSQIEWTPHKYLTALMVEYTLAKKISIVDEIVNSFRFVQHFIYMRLRGNGVSFTSIAAKPKPRQAPVHPAPGDLFLLV